MSAPKFLATGRCLPAKIVTNDDLSRTVDTNDEWVFSRTGIHARHFCEQESGPAGPGALGLKAGGHRRVPCRHFYPRLCQPLYGLYAPAAAGAEGRHYLL